MSNTSKTHMSDMKLLFSIYFSNFIVCPCNVSCYSSIGMSVSEQHFVSIQNALIFSVTLLRSPPSTLASRDGSHLPFPTIYNFLSNSSVIDFVFTISYDSENMVPARNCYNMKLDSPGMLHSIRK